MDPISAKLRKMYRAGSIAPRDTVVVTTVDRRGEEPETLSQLMSRRDEPCRFSFKPQGIGKEYQKRLSTPSSHGSYKGQHIYSGPPSKMLEGHFLS